MANKNALNNLVAGKGRLPSNGLEDQDEFLISQSKQSYSAIDLNAVVNLNDSDNIEVEEQLEIAKEDLNLETASKLNEEQPVNITSNGKVETKDVLNFKRESQENLAEIDKLKKEIIKLNEILSKRDKELIEANESLSDADLNHSVEIETLKQQCKGEIDEKDRKIQDLESEIKTLSEELNNSDSNAEIEEELEKLHQELSDVKRNNSRTITQNEKDIKRLKDENNKLSKQLENLQDSSEVVDVEKLREEWQKEVDDLIKSKEKEFKNILETELDKVKSSKTSTAEIKDVELHKFVLNYVCKDLVKAILNQHKSKIYTVEYEKEILEKFLNGSISSQDSFLKALLTEVKSDNIQSEFLGSNSENVVEYFLEQEVVLE